MSAARVLPVFSVAFAVLYVCAVEYNLALFTYHPQLRQWGLLVEAPRSGIAMYWYGWLATASLGGMAASVCALGVPKAWTSRIWSGWSWAIPMLAMLFIAYLLRGYFFR